MKIEFPASGLESFTITEAPVLDPITVVMRDVKPGHGLLIVACFGEAWCHYWNAMGGRSVRQFVSGCDADYLADKLGRADDDPAYLLRIATALRRALAPSESPKEGLKP